MSQSFRQITFPLCPSVGWFDNSSRQRQPPLMLWVVMIIVGAISGGALGLLLPFVMSQVYLAQGGDPTATGVFAFVCILLVPLGVALGAVSGGLVRLAWVSRTPGRTAQCASLTAAALSTVTTLPLVGLIRFAPDSQLARNLGGQLVILSGGLLFASLFVSASALLLGMGALNRRDQAFGPALLGALLALVTLLGTLAMLVFGATAL